MYWNIADYSVVRVSGEQWRNSATHIQASLLPHTPYPSRLPHSTEQTSMCCTVGPYWLFILNVAACACPSQTPYLFPQRTHHLWMQKRRYRSLVWLPGFLDKDSRAQKASWWGNGGLSPGAPPSSPGHCPVLTHRLPLPGACRSSHWGCWYWQRDRDEFLMKDLENRQRGAWLALSCAKTRQATRPLASCAGHCFGHSSRGTRWIQRNWVPPSRSFLLDLSSLSFT